MLTPHTHPAVSGAESKLEDPGCCTEHCCDWQMPPSLCGNTRLTPTKTSNLSPSPTCQASGSSAGAESRVCPDLFCEPAPSEPLCLNGVSWVLSPSPSDFRERP